MHFVGTSQSPEATMNIGGSLPSHIVVPLMSSHALYSEAIVDQNKRTKGNINSPTVYERDRLIQKHVDR